MGVLQHCAKLLSRHGEHCGAASVVLVCAPPSRLASHSAQSPCSPQHSAPLLSASPPTALWPSSVPVYRAPAPAQYLASRMARIALFPTSAHRIALPSPLPYSLQPGAPHMGRRVVGSGGLTWTAVRGGAGGRLAQRPSPHHVLPPPPLYSTRTLELTSGMGYQVGAAGAGAEARAADLPGAPAAAAPRPDATAGARRTRSVWGVWGGRKTRV